MASRACVECGEEELEIMIPMSRLTEDDNERRKIVTELWCFSCAFREMVDQYNEIQKTEVKNMFKDTRFMTDKDKKTYTFRPPH